MGPLPRRAAICFLVAASFLTRPDTAGGATAHEVPADVAVQIWVRPSGETLTVLVRVPLEAMRDVDFPVSGPGHLVLEEVEPYLREAAQLWVSDYLSFRADGRPLPDETIGRIRLALPGDRSFQEFDDALTHFGAGALDPATRLTVAQAQLDVELAVPIQDASARFTITPELAHLGVSTRSVIHFVLPDGAERVFQYRGNPGELHLDPSALTAAGRFVADGFWHILGGLDHLLFLLCLIIPFRTVRPLVPVVTAFTVAHSITLVAAVLGLTPRALWFPALVETLIALSIVYMALENMLGRQLGRRWGVAFAFGLVHGFGFSFFLTESLQFAGRQVAISLLAFNAGVELGQVAALVATVPVLSWAIRRTRRERTARIILSALVAHSAWHWMTERGSDFLAYDLSPPELSPLFLAGLVRWAMLLVTAALAAWLLAGAYGRLPAAWLEPEAMSAAKQ